LLKRGGQKSTANGSLKKGLLLNRAIQQRSKPKKGNSTSFLIDTTRLVQRKDTMVKSLIRDKIFGGQELKRMMTENSKQRFSSNNEAKIKIKPPKELH